MGDRFSGSVFSDLHGSVATMLDGDGHFTPAKLQSASIGRLTVSGALVSSVDGYTNILAGRGISNLTVRGQSPGGLSVNGVVATGSQALASSWSFGSLSTSFDPALFEHVPGASGGDVINAHFSGGLRGILTGDGEDISRGHAGSGGSIVNVTMGSSPEGFQLQTGSGGDSNTSAGRGGAGGGIVGFRGAFHSSVSSSPSFSTGHGGEGIFTGNGGAGGTIRTRLFSISIRHSPSRCKPARAAPPPVAGTAVRAGAS